MEGLTQEQILKELGLKEKTMLSTEEKNNESEERLISDVMKQANCLKDEFATEENTTINSADIEQATTSVATSSPDALDISAWAQAGMKGFYKVDDCTAKYVNAHRALTVKLLSSKRTNKREYLLAVCNKQGFFEGVEDKNAYFKPDQLENQVTAIDSHLKNLVENFNGCIADIKVGLAIIEKNRLLKPKPIADFGTYSIAELYYRLGEWFIDHVDDNRVAIFSIKGLMHVCLCQRGDKTPAKIFKEVFAEVTDNNLNRPEIFKRELYDKGLFIHDVGKCGRDYQLTVSRSIQSQLGLANDKVISIKFPEEIMTRIIEEHNNICSQKEDTTIWIEDCEEVEDTTALEIAKFVIVKPDREVELYA